MTAQLPHPLSGIVHVEGAGHNVRRDQKARTLAALVGSDPASLPALVG